MAIQMGTINVVAVELVIILARIMAKKPKMASSKMLFNIMKCLLYPNLVLNLWGFTKFRKGEILNKKGRYLNFSPIA
jgi:hypothetical protein